MFYTFRMCLRKVHLASILITAISLILICPSAFAEGCFVRQIQDAKTLRLLDGEKVRLIGISVPEEKNDQAVAFLRTLVSGSVVALEYDLEKVDSEGNILAYVWFKFEPRGKKDEIVFPKELDVHYVVDEEGEGDFFVLLNTTMVKSGYALPSQMLPNEKYTVLLNKLYEERPIETVQVVEVTAKAEISPE